MAKYIKRPIPIDAVQWFKQGDSPHVEPIYGAGDMVGACCGHPSNAHGFIKTLEGTLTICPGSWVATGIKGEHWPIRDDIFRETYVPLPTGDSDR